MMSRGQRGSKGQRQKAAINGSLNKKRELILPSLSPSTRLLGPGRRGNSSRQAAQGQTAWLSKLLSVMAGKSGRPLLIDQSKGNIAANLQTRSGKANRICFISCQIHRRCRPLLSTSAQLIMNISNSSESFGLRCINKHSENQFPSSLMLQTYPSVKEQESWNFISKIRFTPQGSCLTQILSC